MPRRSKNVKQPEGKEDVVSPKPLPPLPPCEGPKLNQFESHHLSVDFIRLLGDPEASAHSHVFEARIGVATYALKVFRYYQLEDDELGLSDCEFENPDLELQVDPFFAECRAFGRINEKGGNGLLAVQCFGFLYFSADRERELWTRFQVGGWNRPDEEYEQDASQRSPFRAIVKKLVSEETKWNLKTSKKILRNLKALNALGVYVFDVRARNIVGGQLVDFSASWTEPHILFKTRDDDEVVNRKSDDLIMFDNMMEDQQVQNAPRALPNRKYCEKLRSAAR